MSDLSPSSPIAMKHQRRLAFAATLTIVGLGMVGIGESELGGAMSLVGWLTLFFAIHTFGRLGPEGRSAPTSPSKESQ